MSYQDQLAKVASAPGFIAALDQSGGSTPKALKIYGIDEDAYSNDEEMFDRIHEMRTRLMTADCFNGERVLGAILFENTLYRLVDGKPSSEYLWQVKNVVPFIKIDKGLEAEADGVQLMKPMPELEALLKAASARQVFGTKERSVIKSANAAGIEAIVAQQFEIGRQVLAHGMMPILEPEVDILAVDKSAAEALLRDALVKHLDTLDEGQQLMFKLTLPETPGFYADLIAHPKVLRVVALSGGYSREEANQRLAANTGMIASFSRALTEGLSHGLDDAAFAEAFDCSIEDIYQASKT